MSERHPPEPILRRLAVTTLEVVPREPVAD